MVPYTLERIDIGRLEEIKLKIIMYCNIRVYGTRSKFNYFLDGTVSQIIQQIESMYVRTYHVVYQFLKYVQCNIRPAQSKRATFGF